MPVPVLTVRQMREWENRSWAAGHSEQAVIQRVGACVAARACQLTKPGDRILLLAGKGHNGDDARSAVSHLPDRQSTLFDVTDPAADSARLKTELTAAPNLIIDGLFGIGLNRPLDPAWIRFIDHVNETGFSVLSVDLPSGLDGDSGATHGNAIRARVTLTVGAPKRGLLQTIASPFVGRLEVATRVGLTPCDQQSDLQWSLPEDFAGLPPARQVGGHKGSFGHLTIIAGSLGFHGAAVLAALGAARAQPGLVTAQVPENIYVPVASQLTSVMVQPWQPGKSLPDSATAILCGPGQAAPAMAELFSAELAALWRQSPLPVVVDATALDWLPAGPVSAQALRVITPHPGEAARLLQGTTRGVQQDRPSALRKLSERFSGCWVVLKGHQTIIGRAAGDIFVNSSGNAFLAQGGSGDLLAGFVAGLLAQPQWQAMPCAALRYAVWEHGRAADLLTETRAHWVIEDLAQALGAAPRTLYRSPI